MYSDVLKSLFAVNHCSLHTRALEWWVFRTQHCLIKSSSNILRQIEAMSFLKLFFLCCVFLISLTEARLPEESLSVPELIRYWGYPVESHDVTTEDGYILTMHRIPYGRNDNRDPSKKRQVFHLQHGLLCSSSNWVTNLPHQSLAFMLADAGFDVWMGNNRGNEYSQKHEKYSNASDEFWNFSFQEFAQYDLPAMVDYALSVTGQNQIFYAGHSEGTMMIFAGLSENEALQKKIKIAFNLAPVARISHATSPITYMSYLETEFGDFFDFFGIRSFMTNKKLLERLGDIACTFSEDLCKNMLFLIAGADDRNMNATRTPVYLTHTPAGTSVKNMLHFCQLVEDGHFQKYDYGWLNFHHYHSLYPPKYKLGNIKTELVLFSGGNDSLADPTDVAWLTSQLKSVSKHIVIPEYNHLDFIWGVKANNMIYDKIIRMAKDHKN